MNIAPMIDSTASAIKESRLKPPVLSSPGPSLKQFPIPNSRANCAKVVSRTKVDLIRVRSPSGHFGNLS